jgi:hypothetical protein
MPLDDLISLKALRGMHTIIETGRQQRNLFSARTSIIDAQSLIELLRWLYLHLPPQTIKTRKMHHGYSQMIRILIRESGSLDADNRMAVGQYLNAVIPFIEQYEKREFPIGPATPRKCLGFC